MTRSARIVVDVSDGTIRITAPLDVSRARLIQAAKRAHEMATAPAKAELHRREMAGRAAVAELYARLGETTWERTLEVIGYDDDHDPLLRDLVAAVRRFARSRLLSDDLGSLEPIHLRRWVRTQQPYATDADYDDWDPTYPPQPVPFWGEEASVKDTTR